MTQLRSTLRHVLVIIIRTERTWESVTSIIHHGCRRPESDTYLSRQHRTPRGWFCQKHLALRPGLLMRYVVVGPDGETSSSIGTGTRGTAVNLGLLAPTFFLSTRILPTEQHLHAGHRLTKNPPTAWPFGPFCQTLKHAFRACQGLS